MRERKRIAVVLGALVIAGLCAGACEEESTPPGKTSETEATRVPEWAEVAPDQIAEAAKHGVPVAFESSIGMRFVLIPAGKYMRGYRPERLHLRGTSAGPPPYMRASMISHEVTLTRPYYIQTHEVTYQQYRHYVPGHGRNEEDPSRDKPEGDPVVFVGWQAAVDFAAWLSQQDSERTLRLPTDAEWEYACRAGSTTLYWWGDQYHSIRNRRANPWGLSGLYTKPGEFCSDWFRAFNSYELVDGEYVFKGVRARTDPTGPKSAVHHVVRGTWSPGRGMAAYGEKGGPDQGFRLVSPLPEKAK